MNSSTSTSDQGWRPLLYHFVAWVIVLGALVVTMIIALDPYDTGRFAMFQSVGVPQFGQRLAAASLGRNTAFDTAIIGNSTMQLIDPSQLNAKAVSLTIPGTGPREQLTVAKWFLAHHQPAHALIIGIDDRWCEANQDLELSHPFPEWLYGDDKDYVIHMLQYKSIEAVIRKIKLMRGATDPLRADGFNDYNAGRTWDREGFVKRLHEPTDEEGVKQPPSPPPYHFAAATPLRDFLTVLPAETKVILVVPPQYHPVLSGDVRLQQHACEKTFAAIAKQRPHTYFANFLGRSNLTTKDEDYWDRLHYRPRVAKVMEAEIGQMLVSSK